MQNSHRARDRQSIQNPSERKLEVEVICLGTVPLLELGEALRNVARGDIQWGTTCTWITHLQVRT